jgi:uncharacterized protein YndB with AHSA1/START domain
VISIQKIGARAVADLEAGSILANVEVAAPPDRIFRALASDQIVQWWVRPGVFDTREWTGDVRIGGRWRASGLGKRGPYVLEGEFIEVDAPRKLVHTWHGAGVPGPPTTVTYTLEPTGNGTRVTLRHSGFSVREVCANTAVGWETSFERLAEVLHETP